MKRTALLLGLIGLGTAAPGVAAGDRTRLTTEHADLWVVYQPDDPTNKLALVVYDHDHGVTFLSNQVALVVAEAARTELPGDFPPLGRTGDPIWILPQTQNPALLFLGLSAAAVPAAVFPQGLTLHLRAVEGPGHFFAWQAGLGGLDIRVNSRDGPDETDQLPLPPDSHAHWNLGFTTNGVYDLVFEVRGRRAGVETNDFSLPTPFRFEVEPLPPPEEKPFIRWQREQWPGVTGDAVIGPGADPDGDGVVNAVEYALGLDPHVPDRDRLPRLRLVESPAGRQWRLEFEPNPAATDILFRAWQTADLAAATAWQPLPGPRVEPTPAGRPRLVFEGAAPAAGQYVRWGVEFLP